MLVPLTPAVSRTAQGWMWSPGVAGIQTLACLGGPPARGAGPTLMCREPSAFLSGGSPCWYLDSASGLSKGYWCQGCGWHGG